MENSIIIFQKLIVLFGFILIGYIAYKKKWVTDEGSSQISGLIVNVFNPPLIIMTVIGTKSRPTAELVMVDSVLAILMFVLLIAISPLIVRMLKIEEKNRTIYSIMLIFSNLGFMGIPLIQAVYGQEATFYVAMYMMVYNILFYSYGVYVFEKAKNKSEEFHFQLKKMFNPGMISCLIALFLFLVPIPVHGIIVNCITYLGNAAVPLSMIVTGISLARSNLKEVFMDKKLYEFTFWKMLVIPAVVALIHKNFHLDPVVTGVMVLMLGMPNGSMPVIMAEDYGLDSSICSRGVALTTILSLITLPLVTYLI